MDSPRIRPRHQSSSLRRSLWNIGGNCLLPAYNGCGRVVKRCRSANVKGFLASGKRILWATACGFAGGWQTESVREVNNRIAFRGFLTPKVMQTDPINRQISMFAIASSKHLGDKANDVKGCDRTQFQETYSDICRQTKSLEGSLCRHKKNLLSLTTVSRGHAALREQRQHPSADNGSISSTVPDTELPGTPQPNTTSQNESTAGPSSQSEAAASILNQLENEEEKMYTCSICQDFYQDPMRLDCGHCFCAICLEKNRISHPTDTIEQRRCVLCKTVSPNIHQNFEIKSLFSIQLQKGRFQEPEREHDSDQSKYYVDKLLAEWKTNPPSSYEALSESEADEDFDDDDYYLPADARRPLRPSEPSRISLRIAQSPFTRLRTSWENRI